MSRIIIKKIGVTKLDVDAVVNAANSALQAGGGVCGKIFEEAGYMELQRACNAIGHCKTGSAVITPGFNLKQKYIIHAVGPIWNGGADNEEKKLRGAYRRSLELAMENDLHSIGFPLISAGIFGYPKDQAWKAALQSAFAFMKKHRGSYDIDIYFAVLNDEILEMGQKELEKQQADYDEWCAGQDSVPRIDMPPIEQMTEEERQRFMTGVYGNPADRKEQ